MPSSASEDSCAQEDDQLGTLPPRTLVLAMYPHFPYFPSYVLSRSEAKRQSALRREVRELEDGSFVGSCVRFFKADTCAVIAATAIEPLLVNE